MRRVVIGMAAIAFLAGCSGDGADPVATSEPVAVDSPTASDSPSPTATPTRRPPTPSDVSTTEEPSLAPGERPFVANTEDDLETPVGNAGLVDVTYDEGPGFESLRFVLDTTAGVGWDVGYTDDPRSDGAGDPVAVDGDAVLSVVLRGITAPFDASVDRQPEDPDVRGASVLVDAVDDAWFEGHWTFFVGLDARRPFRVFQEGNEVILQVDTTG